MTHEIICTACYHHCVIGGLAIVEPPKDSPPTILKEDGSNLIDFCKQNYVAPSEDK